MTARLLHAAAILGVRRVRPAAEYWRDALPSASRSPIERDVYVYVDDVDGVHADLAARGARFVQAPAMAPHGLYEFVAEDLDGHRVVFGGRPAV